MMNKKNICVTMEKETNKVWEKINNPEGIKSVCEVQS